MELASNNLLRVGLVFLVAFLIVIIIFLIIHYYDRVIKWCQRKKKVHTEISIELEKPPQIIVIN